MQDEVIFEGSVFASPTASREAVMNAMRQSSSICDRLEFTHQTQSTDRTYFEWEGDRAWLAGLADDRDCA